MCKPAAESFVHVLGSTPDARLRLDVLRLHHYFEEDLPKKVRARMEQNAHEKCWCVDGQKGWVGLCEYCSGDGYGDS